MRNRLTDRKNRNLYTTDAEIIFGKAGTMSPGAFEVLETARKIAIGEAALVSEKPLTEAEIVQAVVRKFAPQLESTLTKVITAVLNSKGWNIGTIENPQYKGEGAYVPLEPMLPQLSIHDLAEAQREPALPPPLTFDFDAIDSYEHEYAPIFTFYGPNEYIEGEDCLDAQEVFALAQGIPFLWGNPWGGYEIPNSKPPIIWKRHASQAFSTIFVTCQAEYKNLLLNPLKLTANQAQECTLVTSLLTDLSTVLLKNQQTFRDFNNLLQLFHVSQMVSQAITQNQLHFWEEYPAIAKALVEQALDLCEATQTPIMDFLYLYQGSFTARLKPLPHGLAEFWHRLITPYIDEYNIPTTPQVDEDEVIHFWGCDLERGKTICPYIAQYGRNTAHWGLTDELLTTVMKQTHDYPVHLYYDESRPEDFSTLDKP